MTDTDLISLRAADNFRMVKSKTILTPAAATYRLALIPRYAFIMGVWFSVETIGDSDTVSIGWLGNGETAQPAGFLSLGIAKATELGLKSAQHDTLVAFEGKYFADKSGMLTMTVGTIQSTGLFHVFVSFAVIQ